MGTLSTTQRTAHPRFNALPLPGCLYGLPTVPPPILATRFVEIDCSVASGALLRCLVPFGKAVFALL